MYVAALRRKMVKKREAAVICATSVLLWCGEGENSTSTCCTFVYQSIISHDYHSRYLWFEL